jgi:hypothetical protein
MKVKLLNREETNYSMFSYAAHLDEATGYVISIHAVSLTSEKDVKRLIKNMIKRVAYLNRPDILSFRIEDDTTGCTNSWLEAYQRIYQIHMQQKQTNSVHAAGTFNYNVLNDHLSTMIKDKQIVCICEVVIDNGTEYPADEADMFILF